MKPADYPDDATIAKAISEATDFVAFLRLGPWTKHVEPGHADYASAKATADRLAADHSRFGKRGMVYAVTPAGLFPCDDAIMALVAGLERN